MTKEEQAIEIEKKIGKLMNQIGIEFRSSSGSTLIESLFPNNILGVKEKLNEMICLLSEAEELIKNK